jgi:hypothetical protein
LALERRQQAAHSALDDREHVAARARLPHTPGAREALHVRAEMHVAARKQVRVVSAELASQFANLETRRVVGRTAPVRRLAMWQ